MDYETLRYERDGHVTVLTYDRPEHRNAVSRRMNDELHHAWQRFRDAEDEFVLVITGEGTASRCSRGRTRMRSVPAPSRRAARRSGANHGL